MSAETLSMEQIDAIAARADQTLTAMVQLSRSERDALCALARRTEAAEFQASVTEAQITKLVRRSSEARCDRQDAEAERDHWRAKAEAAEAKLEQRNNAIATLRECIVRAIGFPQPWAQSDMKTAVNKGWLIAVVDQLMGARESMQPPQAVTTDDATRCQMFEMDPDVFAEGGR